MSKKPVYFVCLAFFLLISHVSLMAQSPRIEIQRTFGGTDYESAPTLVATADGGYIMSCRSPSSNGQVTGNKGADDIWVVKLNADLSMAWQKSYGGSGYDVAPSIVQTTDGGYIIGASSTSNDGDVTGHHGDTETLDIWIFKINSTGVLQWQKSLGSNSLDYLSSIRATPDGGCVAIGYVLEASGDVAEVHGEGDIWSIKLSSSGLLEWQETHGGLGDERGYSINLTPDGGYIIGGMSGSTEPGYGNHIIPGTETLFYDAYVCKLNASGKEEWRKLYGGYAGDEIREVLPLPDGSYMAIGRTNSTNGDVVGDLHGASMYGTTDLWLLRLSNTGGITWQRGYGGKHADLGSAIRATPDNGFVVLGWTYPYDENYNATPNDGDLTGTPNHGAEREYSGNADVWVFKINAAGQILWQKTLGGSNEDYPKTDDLSGDAGLALSPEGGVVFAAVAGSNDFDVSGSHGGDDIWVVKLSPCPSYSSVTASVCQGGSYSFNGQQLNAAGVYKSTLANSTGCDSIVTLTLNVFALDKPVIVKNTNNLVASGYSSYQWYLDDNLIAGATDSSYSYNSSGNYTVRVTNANGCGAVSDVVNIPANGSVAQEGAMVVPNPAKDFVTIRFPNAIASFYISIVNMEGKKIGLQSFANTNSPRLDVRKLPAGVYLLRLFGSDGSKASYKMIKGK